MRYFFIWTGRVTYCILTRQRAMYLSILDYLNVIDGVEALIALGEKGKSGEIYNIVSGKYKPLKAFIEYLQRAINSGAKIHYAMDKKTLFSLQVDVNKIQKDTEWNGNVELYV